METLKMRLACARTCYALGTETSHLGTADKYRIVGHCIIERTEKLGVLYRPVHYPDITLVADPDEFNRLQLAKSEEDWFQAGERLSQVTEDVPVESMMRHRKTSGLYRILGHCVVGNELAEGLLYTAVDHPSVAFMRPLAEFYEEVEAGGVNGPRFLQEIV